MPCVSALARAPRRALHTAPVRRTLWSFMDAGVYGYASRLSEPEPPALRRVRLAALAEAPAEAQKMVSPLQGAFMASLVRAQRPRAVLELGCYIGYSALWLAHGLGHEGRAAGARLWTCERDPAAAQRAQENISSAGLSGSVTVLAQSADSVLEGWDPAAKLDLVFIDANKSAYQRHYDLILDRDILHDHGQIIVDNVLFHGKVHTQDQPSGPTAALDSPARPASAAGTRQSRIAAKLYEFNQHVASDPRTSQVILPVFDGLMLIQKLQA
ncbi:hypothetical protein LPJ61_004768 [Coemansia biformis]|uniref:catechol O-methyltransferase n=1 Tax=Coemansia biformis TaxID=1286918 RepID=A0A9W8CUD3_9FUNG|nr:hypothetical protein LPJ61_004768 [Coemansia biformis]